MRASCGGYIRGALDYLAGLWQADPSVPDGGGNFPSSLEAQERASVADLVQWCHGAPGIAFTFARAAEVFGCARYRDLAVACGAITWHRGLLRKGPGLCHGGAGNGYALLRLYRLTADPRYLHRARQFAAFYLDQHHLRRCRVPDAPLSLFEGRAGWLCYLSDLATNALSAVFPAFEL